MQSFKERNGQILGWSFLAANAKSGIMINSDYLIKE